MLAPLATVLGAPADRWMWAFSAAVLVVLAGGWLARRTARDASSRDAERAAVVRGNRRRAGALLACGPVVGLLVAPRAGGHVAVAAVGALALGVFGAAYERRRDAGRVVALVVLAAAVVAAAVGVRFAPTGVGVLDVVLAVVVVLAVTWGFEGLGNADALVPGLGAVSALGLLALAGFAEQLGVANGAAGLLGACVAFLAYNLPPASLFAGRGGRLATGYALAVLALSVDVAAAPPGALVVPLLVLAVPLLDAGLVLYDRAGRRQPALRERRDHLVHRLVAYGATRTEAVLILVAVQAGLVVLAVLAGRDVLSVWLVAVVGVLVVGALGGYALRAPLERPAAVGLTPFTRFLAGTVVVVVALGVVPLVLDVPDVTDTMDQGRRAAERGLRAARAGDAAEAGTEFRRAAAAFAAARDRLGSARYQAARVVPGVASNLRAARTLADIGHDLATNGVAVTTTVQPEALAVVDGRVPLEEVERVTPALVRGADTLERALARLRGVAREPYLLGPVREAVVKVRRELRQGAREARNTATAARLASAIFGGDGETRRYLLVVQNPAENRGTGGLIGSFGILTATDGRIHVGRMLRTTVWNAALEAVGDPDYDAPEDYLRRYGPFRPQVNLQNVNLSPDFPTVGKVLESLAPQAGLGDVDGVIAVDPAGLAALLELTGPVSVPGWPTPVADDNVVDVTLRDAYAAFADTPERADFLGDVAQAVVDEATSDRLGDPARVAQALGRAAHGGHLVLSFTRPEEQRLAERVGAAGALVRGGDSLHVTEANIAANKLDYYLERTLDYRVEVRPDATGRGADAAGTVSVQLANTAPATGLPQIVAGPYEGAAPGRFQEGENVSYVAVYTPLELERATLDGTAVTMAADDELGLRVYSTVVRLLAGQDRTLRLDVSGRVRMARGGWYELELGSQPMVQAGQARVSVSVPPGYRITAATRLRKAFDRRATGTVRLDRPTTIRVRIEPADRNLLERLDGRG